MGLFAMTEQQQLSCSYLLIIDGHVGNFLKFCFVYGTLPYIRAWHGYPLRFALLHDLQLT